MNRKSTIAAMCLLGFGVLGAFSAPRAAAQDPILTPIIIKDVVVPAVVNEVAPIIVSAVAPKPKVTGLQKFEGFIVHANVAQVTVRAKGNDLGIQTFALNQTVAGQMQKIVDNGGYQYGDKVTVYYDPTSHTVVKLKGKPSRPL